MLEMMLIFNVTLSLILSLTIIPTLIALDAPRRILPTPSKVTDNNNQRLYLPWKFTADYNNQLLIFREFSQKQSSFRILALCRENLCIETYMLKLRK